MTYRTIEVSARTSGWVRSALPMGEVRALTGSQAPRLQSVERPSKND
jgi:hypothetical protein